jgi:nicotinamidase-related amidase
MTQEVRADYIPLVIYRKGSWKKDPVNEAKEAEAVMQAKIEAERTALVVVDMQVNFKETKTVLAQCLSLVKDAISRQIPIFVLEFGGFGETHVDLIKPIVKKTVMTTEPGMPTVLPVAHFVKKDQMDGSPGIKAVCDRTGDSPLMWKICGVYTTACVLATTNGLLKRFPESQASIVKEAVMDSEWNMKSYEAGSDDHFGVYKKMERTLLI